MSSHAIFELCHALRAAAGERNEDKRLAGLTEVCARLYPGAERGSAFRFAIGMAYRNLVGEGRALSGTDLVAVATRLDAAFRQRRAKQTHLCPLDTGDVLPRLKFGPNALCKFAHDELTAAFDPFGVLRADPAWRRNIQRLCEFAWLVVEDEVEVPAEVAARSLPFLFERVFDDHSAIVPHKSKYPERVEDALFALLLIPWGTYIAYGELDWRPFRVPWVFTITDDPFVSQRPVPSADTLTWEPDFLHDPAGNEIESERPTRFPLEECAVQIGDVLNDGLWQLSTALRVSRATPRPVQHFLVRAFLADEIDEFLAHIATIEAALGREEDHDPRKRREYSATNRLMWRVGGLLSDDAARATGWGLYRKRSDFLHGKPMGEIAGADRRAARDLARRVICAILGEVGSLPPGVTYEDRLELYLRDGRALDPSVAKARLRPP